MKIRKLLVQLIVGTSMLAGFSMTSYAGEWKKDSEGYKYLENGRYVQSSWLRTLSDGSWYHFNNRGYMDTGWIMDGKWYYLDATNGYLMTNRWIGNYYVGSDGAMLTNTTTPDGYRVGGDGAWDGAPAFKSLTSTDLTPQQVFYVNEATNIYINTYGGNLPSVANMSDSDIVAYIGTMIHYYGDTVLGGGSTKTLNYKYYGAKNTVAYPVTSVIECTEDLLGRQVPSNFRDILFEDGYGTSNDFVGPIFADGEGYKTFTFNSYSLSGGKLVARGIYNDESSGGEVLSRGTIEAVFVRNDASERMGMSLESVTLSK